VGAEAATWRLDLTVLGAAVDARRRRGCVCVGASIVTFGNVVSDDRDSCANVELLFANIPAPNATTALVERRNERRPKRATQQPTLVIRRIPPNPDKFAHASARVELGED
jgi:hypothetical protein